MSVMGNKLYPVHPLAVDALLHAANSAGPFAARGQNSETFLSPLSSEFAVLNDADSEQDASSSLQPQLLLPNTRWALAQHCLTLVNETLQVLLEERTLPSSNPLGLICSWAFLEITQTPLTARQEQNQAEKTLILSCPFAAISSNLEIGGKNRRKLYRPQLPP